MVILVFLVSGCATTDDPYHGLDSKSRYYRARKGDTIYGISKRVGRDSGVIAKWNGLSAPYRIDEGQTIRLFPPPESAREKTVKSLPVNHRPKKDPAEKSPSEDSSAAKTLAENIPADHSPAYKNPVEQNQDGKDQTVKSQAIRKTYAAVSTPISTESALIQKSYKKKIKVSWIWPLKGVIAKNYSQTGRKGVDIAGKYGEPVLAAADGRIVYSGQGLIGYGNLVIVKHDAHFLSAYGNNSRLLVREGDNVKMGQRIAEVGMGSNKQPVLHFEIRKDGKPVNPIQHLPKP